MKFKAHLTRLLALAVLTVFVGCGGDDTAATDIPTDTTPVAAEQTAKKTSVARKKPSASGGSSAAARSFTDRVNAALDKGNYMGAVDIAIKSGKSRQENMDNLLRIQCLYW